MLQTCAQGNRWRLSLSQGQVLHHAGGLSMSWDRFYTHDGACPSPTCPNLSHKVGLEGRGISLLIHDHHIFSKTDTALHTSNTTCWTKRCGGGSWTPFAAPGGAAGEVKMHSAHRTAPRGGAT